AQHAHLRCHVHRRTTGSNAFDQGALSRDGEFRLSVQVSLLGLGMAVQPHLVSDAHPSFNRARMSATSVDLTSRVAAGVKSKPARVGRQAGKVRASEGATAGSRHHSRFELRTPGLYYGCHADAR